MWKSGRARLSTQGDIQGMQDQVKILAGQVSRDASEASASVSTIAALDHVKRNMESACSTLKEATELSGLFIKVEAALAHPLAQCD